MENQIWTLLNNTKFKSYYTGFLFDRYQRLDRNLNIFLALVSSGSIASWTYWSDIPEVWALIIAVSQVVQVVKPYFPYYKYAKELNRKTFELDALSIEVERLWYDFRNQKNEESKIADRYFEHKKRLSEIEMFDDETVLKLSKKIEDKANERMRVYLKNEFEIQM